MKKLTLAVALVAFAGIVPSPLASPASGRVAKANMHHDHVDGGNLFQSHDNERAKDHADPCCGLHAFFTGVLPAPIVIDPVDPPHRRLSVGLDNVVLGIDPSRLDRPPRPSAVI